MVFLGPCVLLGHGCHRAAPTQHPTGLWVFHQKNKGLPSARNRGFTEAQGEFVLPLDCDDWLEASAIEQLLKAVEGGGESVFAFPQMILEDQGAGTTIKHYNGFEQLFFNQLPYCLLLPKNAWEIVKIHDFPLIFHEFLIGFHDIPRFLGTSFFARDQRAFKLVPKSIKEEEWKGEGERGRERERGKRTWKKENKNRREEH